MILDLIAVGLGLIILWKVNDMSAALARLQAELAENTSVTASVLALITGLSDQLRAAAGDEAAINAIADGLDENSAKLAAAVASNTEAEAAEEIPATDLEPIEEAPADETGGGDTTGAGDGIAGDEPTE